MTELISPVAMGIISDPPTIVISYDRTATNDGERSRRKRKMPLRDFTDRSNVKRYVFNLRQRHTKYLANVIDVTLEKMLRIIQEIQKGNSIEASLSVVNKEYSVDPDEDLNKLSPVQLAQRKAVMDETFHKNLVKPDDPDFVYDREVKFDVKNERNGENDWDDDSDKLKLKIDKFDANGPKPQNTEINEIPAAVSSDHPASLDPPVVTASASVEIISNQEKNLPCKGNEVDDHDNNEDSLKLINLSGLQINLTSTPIKNASLTEDKTKAKLDDESSSINDIEEALVHIESGVLDEEDEDFWQ